MIFNGQQQQHTAPKTERILHPCLFVCLCSNTFNCFSVLLGNKMHLVASNFGFVTIFVCKAKGLRKFFLRAKLPKSLHNPCSIAYNILSWFYEPFRIFLSLALALHEVEECAINAEKRFQQLPK